MTLTKTISLTNQHRGFSLIEVMVAMLVLSIGLLGLAALQTTSLQYNTGSYYRTQATLMAYDIIDRMRANISAVADANGTGYDQPTTTALTVTTNCDTTSCTSSQLATYDVGKWYSRLTQTIPIPAGKPPTIDVSASKQATVTIYWTEHDMQLSQSWVVQL